MIKVEDKAHDFSLPDQNGEIHSLSDYKGKWLVLYFYPKDNTPGCTKEACGFRDLTEEYSDRGIKILGISKDSLFSHKKFSNKYLLDFPILSDESKEVIKAYGAWGIKKFMGREFEGTTRKTFVINPKGKISKIYQNVNPLSHAQEVLKDIPL